jgi:predicted enzyme related to lactoylglutathione lyase
MRGKFSWYELVTTDVEAAKAFYTAVVGWTAAAAGEGSDYTVLSAGERGVAGMLALAKTTRPAEAGPQWMGYIDVEDVDATLEQLVRAGGRILRPAEDIPGMLRFAVVADPQGIAFVVFTPVPQMPDTPPLPRGTLGKFGWRELITSDWKGAFDFYSGLFGWTKTEAMDMGAMGVYQTWTADGGDPDGGMMNAPPGMPGPGHWAFYINVDSIEAAVGRLTAAGGKVIMGPQEVPGPMWVVQGLDPQGALFSLLSARP